ncbi:MAG: hypothetical protein COB02_13420 [Candidatus Cloacimonadota bacterium]|nr:MAG: hypothetical protein COB02_13420 [Candidatus Cloacimonadota bacterium]
MTTSNYYSLKNDKFNLAIILLVISVFLFTTFIFIEKTYKNEQKSIRSSLETILSTTHQALDTWQSDQLATVKLWAAFEYLQYSTDDLLKVPQNKLKENSWHEEFREYLKNILDNHGYQGFFIIDRNLINLSSMRDSNIGNKNLLHIQPSFFKKIWSGQAALSAPIKSDVNLSNSYNVSMFSGAPIKNEEGDIIAAFCFRIDILKDFTKILKRGRIGESGETYAINKDGWLLSESRFRNQLIKINLLKENQSEVLNIKIVDPQVNLLKNPSFKLKKDLSLTYMAEEVLNSSNRKKIQTNLDGYRDYRGVFVLGSFIWDDKLKIGITSEIDKVEAYKNFSSNKLIIQILSSLSCIMFLAIFLLFQRHTKKLNNLVEIRTNELNKAKNIAEQEVIERKKAEQEIKFAMLEVEQLASVKSDFLANMSHEIRTPMNGVLGVLTLLEDTKLDKEQSKWIEVIRTCSDGMMTILNDILDISKIEANKLDLEMKPFSLKKCVADSIFLLDQKASEKGVHLRQSIDSNVPDGFVGDITRLKQIMVNLISNAIKFTHEGEVSLSINSRKKDDDFFELNFAVKDNGIGISKEDQKKLFQSFSQVDTSTTRKYGGTGLGLSICSSLVKLMNGEIWVESDINQGATFYFKVLLKSVEVKEVKSYKKASKFDKNLANKIPLKILLVEDNAINQKIATRLLQKLGYKVDVACDGLEALDQLEKKTYDLVYMDLQMPNLNGIEATKQIVKKWGDKRPRIIAMTANVQAEDKRNCLNAGMDDFVGKPIKLSALIDSIYDSKKN